jgi:hypothetical protein
MRIGAVTNTILRTPKKINVNDVKLDLSKLLENLTPRKLTPAQLDSFVITDVKATQTENRAEKLIYSKFHDGTKRVYKKEYANGKLYHETIYDTSAPQKQHEDSVFDFYYAYENGRIKGVARHCSYLEGSPFGVYCGNDYTPYPFMVKMKGEKDFHKVDAHTINELRQQDPRFNPTK